MEPKSWLGSVPESQKRCPASAASPPSGRILGLFLPLPRAPALLPSLCLPHSAELLPCTHCSAAETRAACFPEQVTGAGPLPAHFPLTPLRFVAASVSWKPQARPLLVPLPAKAKEEAVPTALPCRVGGLCVTARSLV